LDVNDCIGAVKRADVIFNLAVYGGGILRNSTQSGQILTTNLLLQTNIIEAVRLSDAERYLFTSSVCAYPADLEMMSEDLAWQGPPDRSHEGFGWAKRIGEMQCRLYAEQYGMRIAIVRPTNSYGPYDNFDLKSSHVIPALVRKAVDRADPYVVWGNGATKREFIYSADVARGMILAIEKCPVADPINLGSGKEISILELTQLILKLTEHKPSTVVFDESKPRGQSRRVCDVRKAEEILGFHAEVAPSVGLKETIEWYRTEGHE
jgi:GDP-L-fucose synthase